MIRLLVSRINVLQKANKDKLKEQMLKTNYCNIITSILYIYKTETQEVEEKISLLINPGTFNVIILWKTILRKFSDNVCI